MPHIVHASGRGQNRFLIFPLMVWIGLTWIWEFSSGAAATLELVQPVVETPSAAVMSMAWRTFEGTFMIVIFGVEK
jgi:hypothetical protein